MVVVEEPLTEELEEPDPVMWKGCEYCDKVALVSLWMRKP